MHTLTNLGSAALDLESRAVSPVRELGAYEALWARRDTSFKSLAETFRQYPESVPSDFVEPRESEKYARMALGAIRDAGIKHFGVRVHGAGEYPVSLRSADHPIELLYFQGDWTIASSPCIAIVGTRHPTQAGEMQASKLAKCFAEARYTVVCFGNPELTWPERFVKEGAIRVSTFEEIRDHLASAAPQPDRRTDASGS
jgi:DNA processing protein